MSIMQEFILAIKNKKKKQYSHVDHHILFDKKITGNIR